MVGAADSQTVVDVEGRGRKERDRAEREEGNFFTTAAAVLHAKQQPIGLAFAQAEHIANQ